MISLTNDSRVLVLTGAGVSAESGIPTFRGVGGLWERYSVHDLASPEGFSKDPALVWRFYSARRAQAKGCSPNTGHHALVSLERRLGDQLLLVTQNVDGLHRKAGSERLIEMHGNLFRTKCDSCARPPFDDETAYPQGEVPRCTVCGVGRLRPDIVWFGEILDEQLMSRVHQFIASSVGKHFVFLGAGTSGAVYPAAGLVDMARECGADTWLVNAEPADNVHAFDHFVRGNSGDVLPRLFAGAT